MADEDKGTPSAIDALFGGNAPTATGDETKANDQTQEEGKAPSEEFLKTLHGLDGKVDPVKAAQMAWDNKRSFTAQASELAELRKGREAPPETAQGYAQGFDYGKLKERAPRAYGGTEKDDVVLQHIWEGARAAGMPVKQAQDFVGAFYERLNEGMPERDTRTPDERSKAAREAAVKEHPNGTLVSGDVHAWLGRRHGQEEFSAGELTEIGKLLETPAGLGLLWRLSRQGTAAPADLGPGQRAISDPDEERRKTFDALAVDNDDWQKNKDAIIAKYKRARPEQFAA